MENKATIEFSHQYYLYIMGFNKTLKTMDVKTHSDLSSPLWDDGFVRCWIITHLSEKINQR